MLPGFVLELLEARHRRAEFTCASASVTRFIREQAKKQGKNDTSRVYVYADAEGWIAGFFTLSACSLDLNGLPEAFQKGRSRFPVPATLLGQLGVDEKFTGRKVARFLLSRALHEAYEASAAVASAAVALDIADDASPGVDRLDESAGFVRLPSDPRKMILAMADIAEQMKPNA